MKKLFQALGIFCAILAFYDLGEMANWKLPSGLPVFIGIALSVFMWTLLLGTYLVPIYILYRDFPRSTRGKPLLRLIEWIMIVGVIGLTIYIPCLRYFPGYRPDALESLKYLIGPFYCGAGIVAYYIIEFLVGKLHDLQGHD